MNKDLNDMDLIDSDSDDEDTLKDRFLTFIIGKEIYAFEIIYVREIIGIQIPTEIPNIKPYIKGIINLRGSIIPIVDIRLRFNMDELPYSERTCIIVIHVDDSNIGLIVDEVADVLSIPEEFLSPSPQTSKGSKSKYISKIGRYSDKVIILLDLFKLLYDGSDLTDITQKNKSFEEEID